MKLHQLSLVLYVPFFAALANAAGGNGEIEARKLRQQIEMPSATEKARPRAAEKFILPVSRGFYQRGSQLCWAYATLNGIETMQMAQHPGLALELSRGYLQHSTWSQRLEERLTHSASQLSDRGTAINAIRLLTERGMSQFADYSDISELYTPDTREILQNTARVSSLADKKKSIANDLDKIYGALPAKTHFLNREMTALGFGQELVGKNQWVSFAKERAGNPAGTWGTDPDPDNRGDYQVYFTTLADIKGRIHEALKAGIPVMFSNLAHLTLIYGAEYDAQGEATVYYIKDSYPDYFYTANPQKLYAALLEVTTVDLTRCE